MHQVGECTGTLYWLWSNSEGSGRTEYVGKIAFGDYNCYVSAQSNGLHCTQQQHKLKRSIHSCQL